MLAVSLVAWPAIVLLLALTRAQRSLHVLAGRLAECADDPEGRGRAWVGHAGDAYGLRSGLWIDRRRGVGVAYFVTGLPDDPPPGKSAFSAAEEQAFKRALKLLR